MFFLTSLAALAGAFTLTAGAPAFGGTPPVSVVSCDYGTLSVGGNSPVGGIPQIEIATLRITFVNQAPITATTVQFAVQYADGSQVLDAMGKFSSGTPIVTEFSPSTGPGYTGTAACAVRSVTFADGSTWSQP